MRAEIEVLREVFLEWLTMHDMGPDFWLYTQAEWTQREGEDNLLKGAELVVALEFSLEHAQDELQDLAGGFGYYYEYGHHWNFGFYPLEDWPPNPPESASYATKLKDPRWQVKRQRILKRCKNLCEECGKAKPLQVHHCYYRYGRQVWQYPDGALLGLCDSCHKERQDAELKFRQFLPTVKTNQLSLIQETVRNCQYWFREEDFNELVKTMGKIPGWIPIESDKVKLERDEFDRLKRRAEYRAIRAAFCKLMQYYGHPNETGREWPRNWQ